MRSFEGRATEQLGEELAVLSAQLASALCRWLELLAEFDRRGGWTASGARSCAQWVSWRCALSPGAAREHLRVARALGRLPRTTALFARGELSYSKVRAITRLQDVTREDELLAVARDATAGQLERVVRGYRTSIRLERDAAAADATRFLRLRHEADGSVRISGRLTVEEGAVLERALDEARQALWEAPEPPRGPSAAPQDPEDVRRAGYADALLLLADTALGAGQLAGRSAPERHQVVVHVDVQALVDGRAAEPAHLADGEALAPSVVRRLCCDATLVTAVERAGRTLDVGRRTRAVPPAVRRALSARDRGCRFPGCGATGRLDAHHVIHWADGGATSVANLVSVCRRHHRALHEGGFTLTFDAADGPVFTTGAGVRIDPHPASPQIGARRRLRRRGVSAGTLASGANRSYDKGAAVDAFRRMAPPG